MMSHSLLESEKSPVLKMSIDEITIGMKSTAMILCKFKLRRFAEKWLVVKETTYYNDMIEKGVVPLCLESQCFALFFMAL